MRAVVVLTYRPAPGMLQACLDSVTASGDADVVFVVDNGGAVAAVPPSVRLLRPSRNLGYAGGMNAGIDAALAAGAREVALLNDDIVVAPGWLDTLSAELGGRAGAAQPKLLFTGTTTVNSVGVRLDPTGQGHDAGYGEADGPAFAEPRDIELFTGGAVLLSSAFLDDVGRFDERFFLYYEDVDLALRGAARGWRYRCNPNAVAWHRVGATVAALGDDARFLQERNRLWLLRRHGTPEQRRAGLWLSVRRLVHAPRRTHARALLAGLRGPR